MTQNKLISNKKSISLKKIWLISLSIGMISAPGLGNAAGKTKKPTSSSTRSINAAITTTPATPTVTRVHVQGSPQGQGGNIYLSDPIDAREQRAPEMAETQSGYIGSTESLLSSVGAPKNAAKSTKSAANTNTAKNAAKNATTGAKQKIDVGAVQRDIQDNGVFVVEAVDMNLFKKVAKENQKISGTKSKTVQAKSVTSSTNGQQPITAYNVDGANGSDFDELATNTNATNKAISSTDSVTNGLYVYVDDDGIPHYASTKLDERYVLFMNTQAEIQNDIQINFDFENGSAGTQAIDKRRDAIDFENRELLAHSGFMPNVAAVNLNVSVPRLDQSTSQRMLNHQGLYAFLPTIRKYARAFGVDENLVKSIMAAESAFNPQARSGADAHGLMQLIPGTASRFGVSRSEIYVPERNIYAGVRYLSVLTRMFGGRLDLVAAGYNAGEGAVLKYNRNIPPYRETQNYVRKVAQYYQMYSGQSGSGAPQQYSVMSTYANMPPIPSSPYKRGTTQRVSSSSKPSFNSSTSSTGSRRSSGRVKSSLGGL